MYRNPALREMARGAPCTLRAPGCDGGGATSVWAHSNELRHGKGTGIKAHDLFGCVACAPCHHWLDQGPAPREEKRARFREAWEMSLIMACQAGVI